MKKDLHKKHLRSELKEHKEHKRKERKSKERKSKGKFEESFKREVIAASHNTGRLYMALIAGVVLGITIILNYMK